MRCHSCPLAEGMTCPSGNWPGYCGHVQAEGGDGYWTRKLLLEAGQSVPPPPAPPVRPGLATMAVSFVGAAITHIGSGLAHASPEIVVEREKCCHTCPHHDADADRCDMCGCGLAIKRAWSTSACPDGRW